MTNFKKAALMFAAILAVTLGAATPVQAKPAVDKQPAAPNGIQAVPTTGKPVKIDRPMPPTGKVNTRAMISCGTEPRGPLCYRYAGQGRNAFLGGDAKGFDITTTIQNPALSVPDVGAGGHTLFQIAAVQGSGTSGQRVEIGWAKGQAFCGNTTTPCLYTAAWRDSTLLCLNTGCGFADNASNPVNVKSSLSAAVGTSKRFAILHQTNGVDCTGCTTGWWINYDNQWVGVWPQTVWTGATPPVNTFTNINQMQALGEVAGYSPTETDMGSGTLASATQGTQALDLDVYGSADCDNTTTFCTWDFDVVSQADRWNSVGFGSQDMRYGGPGGHTTVNNLPSGDVCSGVGVGTNPGGYGAVCLYSAVTSGVPTNQVSIASTPFSVPTDGGVARNTCIPNLGYQDGLTTTGIYAIENTSWVKWAWFRDANCAGANYTFDHGSVTLPVGWENRGHASMLRWSTLATCNPGTSTPNTCK